MKYYFVYILLSEKDGKYYVGYTKDLNVRFEQHQSGKVPSTKYRLPFKLIYYEASLTKEDALRRERYLKTYYGKMFLAKRLKSYFTGQEKANSIRK